MGVWDYRVAGIPGSDRPDAASAIRLLTDQVERARRLTDRPVDPKNVRTWADGTTACLVKVYGRDSPNAFSVDACPGADAEWAENRGKIFGGRREISDGYLVSTVEARARLLQECIVSLRSAREQEAGYLRDRIPPCDAPREG